MVPDSIGCSLLGGEEAADSGWGPGQDRKDFLEAEGDRATLPGENQSYPEGDWDGSLSGRSHLQGEGPESGLHFMERQQQGSGREGRGDRSRGTEGSWEAGSSHSLAGGLGNGRERRDSREDSGSQLDRHGQEHLWDAQLGPGTRKGALWGSQFDPERSWPKREGMERILQGDHLDELEGGGGLSRESGRGTAGAVWASGTDLEGARDRNGVGGPGVPKLPGGGSSSSKEGMSPESWGSQGGGDASHGETRGYWGSGKHSGQTSRDKHLQEPSQSRGGTFILGDRSPEIKAEDSLQGTDDPALAKTVVRGRGYATGPGRSGDVGEGGLQELQENNGQFTAGALGRTEDVSRSLQFPQGWTAGQKGAGEPGRIESESPGPQDDTWCHLRKTGTHLGPGILGPGGEEEGGAQAAGLMQSGQAEDARSHRLVRAPGEGIQGPGRTLGDTEGLREPEAAGSRSDFWNDSGSIREGPKGEMGYKDALEGPEQVASRYKDGSDYSRGIGPRNAYSDGTGVSGEMGSGHGAGPRVASGAPVRTESEEGDAYRRGSEMLGRMWSGNKDHCGPAGRGPGRAASDRNSSGGPSGMSIGEAWNWGPSRGQEQIGPEGGHHFDGGSGGPGMVGSVGGVGLKASRTTETTGEGHVEAEPGDPARIRPWGQSADSGGVRAPGGLGSFGEGSSEDGTGAPRAMEPGSLRARGKDGDGDGTRLLDARASGARTGYWDNAQHAEPLAPQGGAASESQWAEGSDNMLGYGDLFKIPEPQGTGHRKACGGGPQGLGPGEKGEAGCRDGSGHLKGTGPADDTSYRNGTRGSREMGSEVEAGYGNVLGGSGKIPIESEAALKDGFGGAGHLLGLGNEGGYRGSSGGSGEMGPEGKMCYGGGSGRSGVSGSLARTEHKAVEHGSGHWTAFEVGTSSKDGPERSRGMGLSNGTGPGVGSGMAGMPHQVGASHMDSAKCPGMLGMQGGPQMLSDRWGSKNSLGAYGTSGISDSLRTVGSEGKLSVSEWQDGPGIPAFPRDRGAPRGEGGSTDEAGRMGASGFLDGRGAVKGESWAGTLESGDKQDFWKAGSGIRDKARFADQGAMVPQGVGDSLVEGRVLGAGSGSSSEAGQSADSSSVSRGRGESISGPANGQGWSHAWAPGWEDQQCSQGSMGAGKHLSGSRAPSSLQEKDTTIRRTQEGLGDPGGRGLVPRLEAAGECGGPWSQESKGSGPGSRRFGSEEDSGVLDEGNSTEWGADLTPTLGETGPQGAWNGLVGSFGRKSSKGESGGIQGPGGQLDKRQEEGKGLSGKQGSLEAKNDKAQGRGELKKYEGQGAEQFGRSGQRSDPQGSRCQAQSEAEVGPAKRRGAEKARGKGQWPGSENGGYLRETLSEDGSRGPPSHLGGRTGAREGRSDVCSEGRYATQSPRSRYKAGTGSFSTEARGRSSRLGCFRGVEPRGAPWPLGCLGQSQLHLQPQESVPTSHPFSGTPCKQQAASSSLCMQDPGCISLRGLLSTWA